MFLSRDVSLVMFLSRDVSPVMFRYYEVSVNDTDLPVGVTLHRHVG